MTTLLRVLGHLLRNDVRLIARDRMLATMTLVVLSMGVLAQQVLAVLRVQPLLGAADEPRVLQRLREHRATDTLAHPEDQGYGEVRRRPCLRVSRTFTAG